MWLESDLQTTQQQLQGGNAGEAHHGVAQGEWGGGGAWIIFLAIDNSGGTLSCQAFSTSNGELEPWGM